MQNCFKKKCLTGRSVKAIPKKKKKKKSGINSCFSKADYGDMLNF